VRGHRLLHDDAAHRIVIGQAAHEIFRVALRHVCRQCFVATRETGELCLLVFVAHVDLRRPVVADEHGGEARRAAEPRRMLLHIATDFNDDLVAQCVAVEQQRPACGALGVAHRFHAITSARVGWNIAHCAQEP